MIIGIGGVSRAGKTTLANQLKAHLPGTSLKILNQDDFVKKTNLPMIKNHIDWEHPDSMDWIALKDAIKMAKKDYHLVLVEGLFAFTNKAISKKYDASIFVSIDHALFMKRKNQDQRWGHEPGWFIEHIWQSFLKFGQIPDYLHEIYIVDGHKKTDIVSLIKILGIEATQK